jgi:hypothetical protein
VDEEQKEKQLPSNHRKRKPNGVKSDRTEGCRRLAAVVPLVEMPIEGFDVPKAMRPVGPHLDPRKGGHHGKDLVPPRLGIQVKVDGGVGCRKCQTHEGECVECGVTCVECPCQHLLPLQLRGEPPIGLAFPIGCLTTSFDVVSRLDTVAMKPINRRRRHTTERHDRKVLTRAQASRKVSRVDATCRTMLG